MRFSSAVLTALFFLNVMGIPSPGILEKAPALRCCCGSTVCRCAPGSKKFCPLQKNSAPAVEKSKSASIKTEGAKRCHFSSKKPEVVSDKQAAPPAKKSCHFSSPEKQNSTESKLTGAAIGEEPVSRPYKLILSPSGCGTNGERASLPSSAKDFYWLVPEVANTLIFYQEHFFSEKETKINAWQSGIDHPPRLLSLPTIISR